MNKEVERLLLLMKSYASDNDAQGYLTNSQVKLLLDYINQLETNIEEAIEILKLCNSQCSKEAISKLERGKE